VVHFCQDDLNRDDVYILDTYYAVLVWQYKSRLADEKELKSVLEIAKEYIEAAPDGRKNCTGYFVPGGSGLEPLWFTCAFHGWDPTPTSKLALNFATLQKIDDILMEYKRKFTYQELLEGKYPKGIETAELENYLECQEFESVFEMTKKEFAKIPKWKQQQIKREKGLY